jgi:uroporphyrinogen-III synthase
MKLYFTQIQPLSDQLTADVVAKGWVPTHLPFRQVVLADAQHALQWLQFDLVVLSSKYAIQWLKQHQLPASLKIAVVGNASNALIPADQRFFQDDAPPNAKTLANVLTDQLHPENRVLLLHGKQATTTLQEALQTYKTTVLEVYETRPVKPNLSQIAQPSMVYFQAPSTVEDYHQHIADVPTYIAVIGPSTAQKVISYGWPIHFQPTRPELTTFTNQLPHATAFHAGTPSTGTENSGGTR